MFNNSDATKWHAEEFPADAKTVITELRPSKQSDEQEDEFARKKIKEYFDEALREGFQQGMAKGYKEGLAKGLSELNVEKETIVKIADNFNKSLSDNDNEISKKVLELSLEIAKRMTKCHLEHHKDAILPIVKEVLEKLPIVEKPARIVVCPKDAVVIRNHLSEELTTEGWAIIEDESMGAGDCIVDTATNHIDATNQTRWERITNSLHEAVNWK